MADDTIIEVRDLSVGYDRMTVLEDIDFTVRRGEIFCILGGSGCGKSTLLKHMIGLYPPFAGDVLLFGESIVRADDAVRHRLMRRFGVTYQGGALFGSMTLAENVELPLAEYTDLSREERRKVAAAKLAQVDLAGFEDYMPAEISGGMRKRAGLARALALDPEMLFFDEPSAGLDPITAAELDRLILKLRDQSGATIVVVTHDLDSVFTIADRIIMLSKQEKRIVAEGDPRRLQTESEVAWVRDFLTRDGLSRR